MPPQNNTLVKFHVLLSLLQVRSCGGASVKGRDLHLSVVAHGRPGGEGDGAAKMGL